ncbi:hypothetical protein YC2023_051713 [Brassica napus]
MSLWEANNLRRYIVFELVLLTVTHPKINVYNSLSSSPSGWFSHFDQKIERKDKIVVVLAKCKEVKQSLKMVNKEDLLALNPTSNTLSPPGHESRLRKFDESSHLPKMVHTLHKRVIIRWVHTLHKSYYPGDLTSMRWAT